MSLYPRRLATMIAVAANCSEPALVELSCPIVYGRRGFSGSRGPQRWQWHDSCAYALGVLCKLLSVCKGGHAYDAE
jgi:hypothetical protein